MENNKIFTQLLYSKNTIENKPYEGIGSAVFLHLDTSFYLVTAAHVFTDNKGAPFFLNINGTTIDLANYKIEKNSEFDIAAIKLEENDYTRISEHTIIITTDLLKDLPKKNTTLVLMGYPRSKNKEKFRNDRFLPTIWSHNTTECTEHLELHQEIFRPIYFAAAYDHKKTNDNNGTRINMPEKQPGISGGIALEFSTNENNSLSFAPLGLIQGIKIKSKLIYGVKFNYIFAWLAQNASIFLSHRAILKNTQ